MAGKVCVLECHGKAYSAVLPLAEYQQSHEHVDNKWEVTCMPYYVLKYPCDVNASISHHALTADVSL